MFTYLSFHWELVIVAVLLVAALGAVAFFLKNWKFAIAAVAVAIAGFMYQGAVTSGIKEQMAKDNAAQVAVLNNQIKTLNDANAAEAARAIQDQDTISTLQDQVRATPKNADACFDIDTARRVQSIK